MGLLGAWLWAAVSWPGQDAPTLTGEVHALLERGRFSQAERILSEERRATPDDGEVLRLAAELDLARGRRNQALEGAVRAVAAGDSGATIVQARALIALARDEEALAVLEPRTMEKSSDLAALVESALAMDRLGRTAEARVVRGRALQIGASRLVEDARGLVLLGRAYEGRGSLEQASHCYLEAVETDEGSTEGLVRLGDLYLRVYGDADQLSGAGPEYRKALDRHPGHVGALVGRARLARLNPRRDRQKARAGLDLALDIDPRSAAGWEERSRWTASERRWRQAGKEVSRALDADPRRASAVSLRGALDALPGVGRIEGPGALDSHAAAELGALLAAAYRFEEAEGVLRPGAEAMGAGGLTTLGRVQACRGRGAHALATLRAAAAAEEGHVDPWRGNMIEVLAKVEQRWFRLRTDGFDLALPREAAPVLAEPLLAELQMARMSIRERYGWVPETEIRVDVFDRWRDFSVRTVGFTGFGALGAAFDDYLTLLSPDAEPFAGQFNWRSTVLHEYAHILALEISRGRVPRWFTEGLSSYEEKRADPAWERGEDRRLVDALANDSLPRAAQLGGLFGGPDIGFGYYLAGLLVEAVIGSHGEEAVVKALKMWGEGDADGQVLRAAFPGRGEMSLEALFERACEDRAARVRVRPRLTAATMIRLEGRGEDPEAAKQLCWAALAEGRLADFDHVFGPLALDRAGDPEVALLRVEAQRVRGAPDLDAYEAALAAGGGDQEAWMALGRLQEEAGLLEQAVASLRRAVEAHPRETDPKRSPRTALARLLGEMERPEERLAVLEAHAAVAGSDLGVRVELARDAERRGDDAKAARWWREAWGIAPFDAAVQSALGEGQETGSSGD